MDIFGIVRYNYEKIRRCGFLNKFLTETHAHTSEVSPCATCDSKKLVDLMILHGYSTVFITNHLSEHTFYKAKIKNRNEKIEFFLEGFELVKKAADTKINVILAMEISFSGCANDYLVYGITESFLKGNADIVDSTIERFYPLAKKNGLYVIQAHPFRFGSSIVNPDFLDGYEIFNANPRHNSNNDMALNWAKHYSKLTTAGTDFHQPGDAGISGMYFENEIKTSEDYIKALQCKNFVIKK